MFKNYNSSTSIHNFFVIACIVLSFFVINYLTYPKFVATNTTIDTAPAAAVNTVTTDNIPDYDSFTISERLSQKLPTSLPAVSPYYGEKVVYLTFDDGPDNENTPLILNILKEYNVKATFFVVGSQVEKYPDVLSQIYLAGHAIGNHTYNHKYRELYKSPDAYIAQLQQTDDIIKKVINVRPHISRAPGGSAGNLTKKYWEKLNTNGYIEVGWNISSCDASNATAEQIVDNITSQMEQKFLWSHAIVLMHSSQGHSETVKALPAIIEYYKKNNFEFRVINLKTPPAW